MTSDLELSNGRRVTVAFGWEPPSPSCRTDPGSPGGPELDQAWDEDGEIADLDTDEEDEIIALLESAAEQSRSDD